MVRKIENWEMTLFTQVSLAHNQLLGKAKYEDENEKIIIDILWDIYYDLPSLNNACRHLNQRK